MIPRNSRLLFCGLTIAIQGVSSPAVSPASLHPSKPYEIEFITAEALKARLDRNEALTIIDVRANSSYLDSNNTVRGAIHINLRRLRSRLSLPPIKDLPRKSEVVTYCACPRDEASVRAAQILLDAGFQNVRVLKGGWHMWLSINGPVGPRARASGAR